MPKNRDRSHSGSSSSSGSDSSSDSDARRRHQKEKKKRKEKHKQHKKRRSEKNDDQAIRDAEELAALAFDSNFAGTTTIATESTAFDWVKKRKVEEKMGLSREQREARDKQRRLESQMELGKLKKQREEREAELQLIEMERHRMRRDRELQSLGNWEEKEEQFHLEQAKQRAATRLMEGRPQPIDLFVISIYLNDEAKTFDGCRPFLEDPFSLFRDLNLKEMDALEEEVQFFLTYEKDEVPLQYWQAVIVTCKDELVKARNMDRIQRSSSTGRQYSKSEAHTMTSVAFTGLDYMQPQVLREIHQRLKDKTYEQLLILHQSVEQKLAAGGAIDVEYWETLLKVVSIMRARLRIRHAHLDAIQCRVQHLEREGRHRDAQRLQDAMALSGRPLQLGEQTEETSEIKESTSGEEPTSLETVTSNLDRDLEESGSAMPEIEPEDVQSSMDDAVTQIQATRILQEVPVWDASDESERMFQIEAAREMDSDEEVMQSEPILESARDAVTERRLHLIHGRFKPRKPRYFNRIQTGFEW